MADLSAPPSIPKATFDSDAGLKKYHAQLAPWLDQVHGALSSLTLAQNLGAVIPEPITVTAGVDGALGSQASCTAPFAPLLVLFRAEALDSSKKPTGVIVGGLPTWSATMKGGDQSVTVSKAPGLVSGTSYAMTLVLLPG